jgi:hypothetical protein
VAGFSARHLPITPLKDEETMISKIHTLKEAQKKWKRQTFQTMKN